MKALRVHAKQDIRVEELELPALGDDEVLVRMRYVGICGSDLHYYYKGSSGIFRIREPLVMGHEVSGTVHLDPSGELERGTPVVVVPATFGEPVEGLEDRPHLWPGGSFLGSASTTPHTQGGMQEYRAVNRSQLRRLPDGLPVDKAVLAEPLGVAIHAVRQAGDITGKRVLVIGCGPIGLCVLAAARAAGAQSVAASDTKPGPLRRAAELGADALLQAGTAAPSVEEYDVIYECSGAAPAISTAVAAVRRAGHIIQVGNLPNTEIGVNLGPIVSKEVSYKGSFRSHDEMDAALDILAEQPQIADTIITHVMNADDAPAALEVARDSERSGKVVLSIWPD